VTETYRPCRGFQEASFWPESQLSSVGRLVALPQESTLNPSVRRVRASKDRVALEPRGSATPAGALQPPQIATWLNLIVTLPLLAPCRYRTEVGVGFPTNDFRIDVTASVTHAGCRPRSCAAS
jgi:hypothetical protein